MPKITKGCERLALRNKDILGMKELSPDEIVSILDLAAQMKPVILSGQKKTTHLTGKSVVTLFYENSTRTRMSFELASKYMSSASANITASGSSVEKGETLLDTGRTLDRMGTDIIIMRHPMSGAPHLLARNVRASVINAGDGMHEHPTQALLDMFTIREHKGKIEGLKVVIIGDILCSRVARSNLIGLTKLGAQVVLTGPETLLPAEIERTGAKVSHNLDDALEGADVVMALRLQKERQASAFFPTLREYSRYFGIDKRRLALAKPDALLLHPGPMNRGVEITSELADGDQSFINEQVTNGVAVRMALLELLARRDV